VARLRRSDCAGAGLARRRCGRGFVYLDAHGRRVGDAAVLERIRALAIPPAWRDVWICVDARGHLQATGFDDAGRKQYLYHPDWRRHRDRAKFAAMVDFAGRLPQLRRRVRRELGSGELDRARVLAAAVRLLDIGCFRIGSEDYAREHGSHGLSTVRREHVSRRGGGEIVFDYPGKSGQRLQVVVDDAAACAAVDELLRRRRAPGDQQLLAYRDGRTWRELRADDVNAYLKECLGGDFTAKDFRTWNATVIAAVTLAAAAPAATSTARRRTIKAAIGVAATCLGNTPAVCRASYVDPRVIDAFLAGRTLELGGGGGDGPGDMRLLAQPRRRARIEAGVLDLLDA
jgi:DNA topoisomerase-1